MNLRGMNLQVMKLQAMNLQGMNLRGIVKALASLAHGLLLPALMGLLLLVPPAAYAQEGDQESPRALPKPPGAQLMQCTQATKANTRAGNANTCYSVFGDPASPFFDKSFSFVFQGFVPGFAKTCIKGTTTMLGAKCDDPPICKVIQPSGTPRPTNGCPSSASFDASD